MITGHTIRRTPGDPLHDRLTVEDHEGGTASFIIERPRFCNDPFKGAWPNGAMCVARDFGLVLTGHRVPYIEVAPTTLDLAEIPPPPGAGVAAEERL